MPDRHDPKLSMRPPAERKPDAAGNDDPLVELAKVVSTRSSSVDAPPKPEARPEPAQPEIDRREMPLLPSETDLARDLETELLNELQASFSMVPEVVGPNAAKSAEPPRATIAAVEPAEEEDRLPEEPPITQEAQPEPRIANPAVPFQPPMPPSATDADRDKEVDDIFNHIMNVEPDPQEPPVPQAPQQQVAPQQLAPLPPVAHRAEQQRPHPRPEGEPRPEPPRVKPPSAPSRRESLAHRIARAAQEGLREEPAPPRMRAEAPRPPAPTQRAAPPARPAPPVSERRRQADSDPFRPHPPADHPPPEPVVAPPRQVESRWDQPLDADAPSTFDPSRFAPLASDSFQPEGAEVDEGGVPADDAFFAPGEGALFEEAQPVEQLETVPGYGDEDLLTYPEDELADMQPRRSRKGPLAIAAMLAVLAIGGVTVMMLRSGGANDPPQIIAADTAPTKITPEVAGTSESDSQSKLIYDRVDPDSEVSDSQLVVTGREQVVDIPPIPEDTASSDVSRVILEGGPTADSMAEEPGSTDAPMAPTSGGTTVASSAPEPAPIGPRKVRTVVVRPDGTIVSSEAVTPGEEQAPPEGDTIDVIADLPPASETPPAPAADENPLLSENFGVEAIDNPAPAPPQPNDVNESPASASIPDIPPPRPAPTSRPAPSAPTVVATPGSTNGPIDVTPASRPAPSGGLGGGFLVQVSSQRSEATALETFSELQRRYPSILGDRTPNIQRADLGERGVYYRVRVGYPTREQAIRMCENLKAAGGDCLLATR